MFPRFTFSAAALVQLSRLRQAYWDISPDDPPSLPGIFWVPTGKGAPGICYWHEAEVPPEAVRQITEIDGIRLLFVVPRSHWARFEGRVLDYAVGPGFRLGEAAGWTRSDSKAI